MIRFDGYYIGSPHKVDDRSKNGWYSRNALLFLKDKRLLWSTKYFKNKEEKKFILSDFNSEGNYTYEINDKELCQLIYKNHPVLEDRIYFEIKTNNELKYKDSNEIMKFVPWKEE